MKNKTTIVLTLVVTLTVGIVAYSLLKLEQSKNIIQPTIATSTLEASLVATSTIDHSGMKLYRNDQFGFEFWYPEGWEWQENVFGGPNSKFNLTVMKINGENTNQNDVINIVSPDFANQEYQDIQNKAVPVIVDNLNGLKYEYKEDINYIDIVVPINKNATIIFGNEDSMHISEFNQILSTFKFLK